MSSSDPRPPWPEPWPAPRVGGAVAGAVAFGLVAVGGIVAGVSGGSDPRGHVLAAIVPLAAGLALTPVHRLRTHRRSTRAVRSVDRELVVPVPVVTWVALWLLLVGTVVLAAVLVGLTWLIGFAGPPNVAAILVGAVLLLAGLPALLSVVELVRGTARRGGLSLSADGVRYRTFAYDVSLSWQEIERVSVVGGDGQCVAILGSAGLRPSLRGNSWLLRPGRRIRDQAAKAMVVVRAGTLSIDPALTFQLVRFYHANPDARRELGTAAAVERVSVGAV